MSTPHTDCSELGIPERLHTNGRAADTTFATGEELYRWYKPGTEILPNGMVSGASIGKAFRDPHDTSVNRARYCESCLDVLYNHFNGNHRTHCGVMRATFSKVESEPIKPVKWRDHHGETVERSYDFRVLHEPAECMYPHAVIAVFNSSGNRLKKKPSAKPAKSALRLALQVLFTRCHEPTEETTLPQ